MFATKLPNSLLTFLKKPASIVGIEKENPKQSSSKTLSLREMAGLQYLGGYVFRNLHHKIRGSSKWKTTSCQQSLSILEAAKLDEVSRSQDLVFCLNRGRLWSICTAAENVLVRAEAYFKQAVAQLNFSTRAINREIVVQKCLNDVDIVSNFQGIVDSSELQVDKQNAKDMLHDIIDLFIKIRIYSFTKHIVQLYKTKQNVSKARSLRKEIKQSSKTGTSTCEKVD